jgi:hypothetical protein
VLCDTVTTRVDELSAVSLSGVVEVMVAVLEIVPLAFAAARMTRVKSACAPAASDAMVQVTVPPAPTAGVVQLKAGPVDCANDWKVVFGGSVSVRVTLWAMAGARRWSARSRSCSPCWGPHGSRSPTRCW